MREAGNGLWVRGEDSIWRWRNNLSEYELDRMALDPYSHMSADDGERYLTPIGRPYPSTMRHLSDSVAFMRHVDLERSLKQGEDPRGATPSDIGEYQRREGGSLRLVDDDEPLTMPERDERERRVDDEFRKDARDAMLKWFTASEQSDPDESMRAALEQASDALVDSIIYMLYTDDEF